MWGPGDADRPEMSPPRERKAAAPGESRKFSWATQRIHDLTKELEGAHARIKDHDKAVKELNAKLQRATSDGSSAKEQRDQLQVR